MVYVEFIGAVAVLQFVFFGFMTGQARRKSGLKAPAVSGDEGFERMYRVQMNTLETIVAFLPALFIAGQHWSPVVVSCLGIVYLIGRMIYWRAYIANPERRGLGFMLSIVPILILVVLAVLGPLLRVIYF